MTNAPIPVVGMDRQRAEETKASPACCKIGTDEFAVNLRGKRCAGVCPQSQGDIIDVSPLILGIGNTSMRSESEPKDSASLGNIAFS